MLAETATIVADSLRFADVTFDQKGDIESYPAEWNKELTQNELNKRLRIARAAWMSSSEVPYGLKMAKDISVGIMKSRSAQETAKPVLRIQNAVITTPTLMRDIEVIEVDE